MEISNRLATMKVSPIRKLIPYAESAKKRGTKIYHLNIGEPNIKLNDAYINALKGTDIDNLNYAPSRGIEELINSIRYYYKRYNVDLIKENIFITNGGSEALTFSILALCDVGDNIVVFEPYYANYDNILHINGVELRSIPSDFCKNFHLPDKEEILKVIDSNTKAILISHPSNPTGCVYTHQELKMLSDISKENGIWIISDEVYREFVYTDDNYESFLSIDDSNDRIVIIDSVSKKFGACGARIGSLISKNKSLNKQILKLCQSRLAVATLEQIGASSLYRSLDDIYLNSIVSEYKRKRDIVYELLTKIDGVQCKKPEGAFYMIVKLPVDDAEKFCIWLLEEFCINNSTVMISPAKDFYKNNSSALNEVRIAYVLNDEDLVTSINILRCALQAYTNKNTFCEDINE